LATRQITIIEGQSQSLST